MDAPKVATESASPIEHPVLAASKDVAHPVHYNKGIECWDYTTSHDMNFLQGNITKYVTRYKHKNGLQDLLKARQYLDRLIQYVETGT